MSALNDKVTRKCQLPGKKRLFMVYQSLFNAHECIAMNTQSTHVYTTIHVHKQTGIIECITCLAAEQDLSKAELDNLSALVGLASSYCNAMVSKYQEGLVPDWIAYLREHWALAIFLSNFEQFRAQVKDQVLMQGKSMDAQDVNKYAKKLGIDPTVHPSEYEKYLSANTVQWMEKRVVQFLKEYQNDLKAIPTVYATPSE